MQKPKELDFGFIWDDKKIWRLNNPIEEIDIDELKQNFQFPYLDKEGTDDWNLTPQELITHPEKEPSHFKKIKEVDMSYPIEIYLHEGTWKILDGVHRYCRALLEGRKTIKVRRISKEMIQEILK